MPDTPRLTVGIPHLDRSPLLARAIVSCLEQKVPVRIIVADQGKTQQTKDVIDRHGDQIELRHLESPATCLWENWDWVARQCDTEFFAWLQDDDVISPNFAGRVLSCFDRFPEADLWMARNALALSPQQAYWTSGNGPWVPMDAFGGIPDQWEGQVLVPTAYFTSWSLSPAVAFRTGDKFTRALDRMPKACDIFAERTILAAMAYDGRFVADPGVAGLWIHHGNNENHNQHHDQPRQTKVLVDWLDELMPSVDGWQDILFRWANLMHPQWVWDWHKQLKVTQREGRKGKYTDEILSVLMASMNGRVRAVRPMTRWERARAWIRSRAAL